jgi:uncharacterized membrane protein YcaP (DUF421 family)
MMEIIHKLFGEGKELNVLQMADRAFVVFFLSLVIIRIAGMRTFGKKSAFDNIMVIILGSVLSRAIVGVSPFFPTIAAGFTMAVIHKIVAWSTVNNRSVSRFFKGEKEIIYENGRWHKQNMNRCTISKEDVLEEVRDKLNQNGLEGIEQIFIESSGKISLIKSA